MIKLNKHFGVGIKGDKQSGKDTVADYLTMFLCPIPVCRISTGDIIRQDIQEAIGADPKKLNDLKNEPFIRRFQQEWGMLRRNENPAYWISKGEEIIKSLKQPHILLFSSLRFEQEATYVRQQFNGIIVHVEVGYYSQHNTRFNPRISEDDHITEQEHKKIYWDFLIRNHGSLNDLRRECKYLHQFIIELLERKNV